MKCINCPALPKQALVATELDIPADESIVRVQEMLLCPKQSGLLVAPNQKACKEIARGAKWVALV